MAEERSIVEYFAEHERYKCGYCGSADTNYSHGMWAHSLTVQDYQDLLDRGWRRSGKYTYKPTMNLTCCPQYTIRCEALKFQLRKSHKKALKKVNRYLIHGIKPEKSEDEDGASGERLAETPSSGKEKQSTDATNNNQSAGSSSSTSQSGSRPGSGSRDSTSPREKKTPKPGSGADPDKPPCKKAKELRKERQKQKAETAGQMLEEKSQETNKPAKGTQKSSSEPKTLEDFLSEPERAQKCAHKLEIRTVRSHPKSREFEDSFNESYKLYHRYQVAIHKDPPGKPSESQYKRFLVDSPLTQPKLVEGGLPMGYGSFHQQYILDGKIICVGVLDILPSLVSSKYLYYDPDYSFLSLGTYSALREIAFVRELNKYASDMVHYYMGFYIHSCPKMKYKGQFSHSYLLCPETYNWCPVEKCSPILDQKTFSRFAEEGKEDENGKIDLDRVLILHARQVMPYEVYTAIKNMTSPGFSDEEEVKEYAALAGRTCALRMLLFRK